MPDELPDDAMDDGDDPVRTSPARQAVAALADGLDALLREVEAAYCTCNQNGYDFGRRDALRQVVEFLTEAHTPRRDREAAEIGMDLFCKRVTHCHPSRGCLQCKTPMSTTTWGCANTSSRTPTTPRAFPPPARRWRHWRVSSRSCCGRWKMGDFAETRRQEYLDKMLQGIDRDVARSRKETVSQLARDLLLTVVRRGDQQIDPAAIYDVARRFVEAGEAE